MVRGTFANIRLQNEMVPLGKTGGFTLYNGEVVTIFEAAMHYKANNTSLVIIAGKEYGTGSSRDWAAKGTSLLGVKAVVAETFERIHRSNLVGMGILPLEFKEGVTRHSLDLTGRETLTLCGIDKVTVGGEVEVILNRLDGSQQSLWLRCRIDTEEELNYFNQGGILPYILRQMGS
jgi:aconitate hydratase